MINPIVKTIELNDGRTITLETGKLAKQADAEHPVQAADDRRAAAPLYGVVRSLLQDMEAG